MLLFFFGVAIKEQRNVEGFSVMINYLVNGELMFDVLIKIIMNH